MAKSSSASAADLRMRDCGTVVAGQIINVTSQLLNLPEPFTVISDSSEVVMMSAAHSELAKVAGHQIIEELRLAFAKTPSWHERLIENAFKPCERDPDADLTMHRKAQMFRTESDSDFRAPAFEALSTCRSTASITYLHDTVEPDPPLWPKRPGGEIAEIGEQLHSTDDLEVSSLDKVETVQMAGILSGKNLAKKRWRRPSGDHLTGPLDHMLDLDREPQTARNSRTLQRNDTQLLDNVALECQKQGMMDLGVFTDQLRQRGHHNLAIQPSHLQMICARGSEGNLLEVQPITPLVTRSLCCHPKKPPPAPPTQERTHLMANNSSEPSTPSMPSTANSSQGFSRPQTNMITTISSWPAIDEVFEDAFLDLQDFGDTFGSSKGFRTSARSTFHVSASSSTQGPFIPSCTTEGIDTSTTSISPKQQKGFASDLFGLPQLRSVVRGSVAAASRRKRGPISKQKANSQSVLPERLCMPLSARSLKSGSNDEKNKVQSLRRFLDNGFLRQPVG
eukprot:TRINITY_DN33605_c1_g3_i2.p1 TRINITY_DN33605_c1_g3~~TRINITY_DN33605_c1_g3_i2.p1  ORF type:complete len:559 (+),score=91.29 TRINITY_DN33605_c1_g3_i2:158-1678(+)